MKTIMKKIQTGVQRSRYCLRSLFVTFLLILTFGITDAWGDNTATITRRALDDSDWSNMVNSGTSSAYITWKGNDAGQHVTFKLSGGTFENYSTYNYFYANARQTHTVSWTADPGYTVNVTRVEILTRSYHTCYVTVGSGTKTGNIKGDECNKTAYANYSPGLGNGGSVAIVTEDEGGLIRANFFIHTINVTYTIEKTEKTVTFNSADFSTSYATEYNIWQDSVNFYLHYIRNWYNNGNGHFYIYTSETAATIDWTPKSGYTIAVTGVSLNGQNASEDHKKYWYSTSKTTFKGSSYVRSHTSSDNTEVKISQSTTPTTYSYTTANNTYIFPSGNALGNSAYFKIRAEKGFETADADNSYEYQINTATLTYAVTPPAPIRKNYSETLSRYQYVEGRANNTVDLTEYFQPFHVGDGVSMFYEVKKKVGETFEIIEAGYDITDDVFKTTNVGIYQVRAKTNATGAFTASAWSSDPIQITIEEVQPLTVVVGSQELFVDETTTMTITEQLNTTEEVEFDYDENFFDYNESTGVLTIKNDGNASFNTIEKSIHITQASDGEYAAVDIYKVFTIKKYLNAITCSWGEEPWSKSLNFDEEAAITFSSNNDTGTPIVVTPGAGVAAGNGSYDAENHKVIAGHNIGTATWTISQAEDYKYQAAVSKTLTVNVGTVSSECYVLDDSELVEWATVGRTEEYSVDGPASKLQFEARRVKLAGVSNNEHFFAEYSTTTEGDSWTRLDPYMNLPQAGHEYWYPFEYDIPQGTKRVRMRSETGATGYRCIQNVKVTRDTYIDIENADEEAITEIDMPINTVGGNVTRNTFYIDYSTCASKIKLVSNNSRVKFAANNSTTYEFDEDNGTRKAIELTYTSGVSAEEIAATITVYTPYEHETLTVNAQTKVLSTTLEYKGASSYAVDHADMLATDLFQVRDENGDLVASPTITLISNATGVINTVSSNTAIDFICGGSATITASFAGVANVYEAASNLGQSITVNKLTDVIAWSNVSDDDKIHVWTDSVIPNTIASANTDIASYSVASANPYLSVTEDEGVYTLNTGVPGEVTLTATSAGDNCTYNGVSASKTIVVDPRVHAIIWDQDLEGIQTDDRGYIINRRITLNAYAVDNGSNPTNVPVSYKITGGGTFATIENGNELVINVANLSGTLSTTITATTTVGTKYAIVSETKTISVVRWGTNTAKSADNTSDIVDGKIVINAPHATFTFSGQTAITEFGYATVGGKPEGYKLAQALDNGDGSKTYNFSWVSTNANCSIQVNKISFWIKAYDSDAFVARRAKVSFDGAEEVSVGTAAMTANDGDFAKFSKPENYTNRNVPVVCWVTGSENFDFYIKNISIEYTVYTTAPSATSGIEEVDRTINTSDKQTVDVRDLFSYAVAPPSDFKYAYEIVGSPEHAYFLADGYTFWADAVGDYTVRAKVNMEEDHRESEWSDEKTIRVNKVPYVFNNSEEDQKWDTENNWTIGSWPIENLPTEDDDVIVRGHLTIDEEITINSMTIDAGEGYIVEIAPDGGLTVGAGGISGATKDKLKLKASREGANKGKTGYLRLSPEHAGGMPELTTELYTIGYYDKSKPDDDIAAWQYVGSPIDFEGKLAKTVFTRSWIYSYVESTDSWVNNRSTLVMQPFTGYKTTQYDDKDGKLLSFKGRLIPNNCLYTIDLACTDEDHGHNLVANSFAAPISIAQFRDTDFVNAEKTIYIYNTGSRKQYLAKGAVANSAGQYTPIAIRTAAEMEEFFGDNPDISSTIAPMQGFFVNATGADAKLKFNYSKLVWNVASVDNQPLRAPKRAANTDITAALKITLEADSLTDNVYMLESEGYELEYEDGYDAHKLHGGKFNVFTIRNDEQLAIDATNSIIGTRVGVRTGEETAYTLEFSHLTSENGLALYDSETEQTIDINEGTQYTFFAEPNAMITERFEIVARADAPAITTGVDNVENGAKVHKFIKDNQLFILKNGVLYNATGAVVR